MPKTAKLLNLADELPGVLRLEVTHAIAEADRLHQVGDATAWRWLPAQIAYFARRHPREQPRLKPIYSAILEESA